MHLRALPVKSATFGLPALVVVLASLASPPAAHAQLVLNLIPPAQASVPGSTLTFSGTLNNPTTSPVFLNGDSYTFSGPATSLALDDSAFFNNSPTSLSAMGGGSDTYTGGFFSVFVSSSAAPGTYAGTFSVLGGADGNAQTTVASETFFVTVAPNTLPVPEASSGISCGLLLGLSAAVAAVRRRKARLA